MEVLAMTAIGSICSLAILIWFGLRLDAVAKSTTRIAADLAAIRIHLDTKQQLEANAKCGACGYKWTAAQDVLGHSTRCPSCGQVTKAIPLQA
jgi:hypothetical protein